MRDPLPSTWSFNGHCDARTGTDRGATASCAAGSFNIHMDAPQTSHRPIQVYPFRLEHPAPDIAVRMTVRLVAAGSPNNVLYGPSCIASGPNMPDREFIFALADHNGTTTAVILRADETDALLKHYYYLEQGPGARVNVNRTTNVVISGSCRPQPNGGVLLSMAIDNKSLETTRSSVHWTSFDGVGIYLLSFTGPAAIAVDDLHASRATPS